MTVLGAMQAKLHGEGQRWQRLGYRLRIRYLSPERPLDAPATLQIEATSKCNLRCPTCSHKLEGDAGRHLSVQELARILDHMPSPPARVILSGIGEPLLNPDFFSLVDTLADRGIGCEFFTNGTLLAAHVRSEILSRGNIGAIVISCDGAQKETFEACRLGADFDVWRQRVGDFMAEASQQRAHTLRTTMSTVVGKGNLGEVEDIMRLAAALGFDAIHLRRLIAVDDASASLVPSDADLSAIPRHEVNALGDDLGLEVSCDYLAPRWDLSFTGIPRCTSPWDFAFVRANGDVQPCSNLWDSQVAPVMGNVLEDDFAAIWHGERFREFRRASALGTNPLCSGCGDNCWS